MKTEYPEEYKKAILGGIFGEKNSRLLREYGYDLGIIKENMYKLKEQMPIAMPRHKYLFDQIAKKEIKKEDLVNYKKYFSEVLRDYRRGLMEKIKEIRMVPIETINQSSSPSPQN